MQRESESSISTSWAVLLLREPADSDPLTRENTGVFYLDPVVTVRTGRRGRPRKAINETYLRNALASDRMISIAELARMLGVSRQLVYRYMKTYGIKREYSEITDGQLDAILRAFRQHRPTAGLQYIMGFMRKCGLRVQRITVKQSIRRVDGVGQTLRRCMVVKRRYYRVARPNALWHMDGHHKLIRWGFVIHGFIDGFCRTVRALPSRPDHSLLINSWIDSRHSSEWE